MEMRRTRGSNAALARSERGPRDALVCRAWPSENATFTVMTKTLASLASLTFALTLTGALAAACSSSSDTVVVNSDAGTDTGVADSPSSNPETSVDASIQPETWTWVPVAGAKCRDGSDTGIGVNINPNSTKVLIFMEGGGACFNTTTCNTNPSKYAEADFNAAVAAGGAAGFNGTFDTMHTNGILSRADAKNPVKDYSMIYVPYCTGDVHAGANPAGAVPMVTGTQQFVGYNNVKLDVAMAQAMLPGTTDVVLAGMSGGGFGVVVNYDQVATAYGSVPVTMIDDSGPPMADPYLPQCLQSELVTLWSLDKTVLVACGDDCVGDGGVDTGHFAINVLKHLGKKYPTRILGIMDSTGDATISSFFGFGADNCTSFSPELALMFTAGLQDIRTEMSFDTNFGEFVFASGDHTSLEGQLDTRVAGGTVDGGAPAVALSDWLTAMIGGTASNPGP